MTVSQAAEIAVLLNSRNELTVEQTAEAILSAADQYVFSTSDGSSVVACVQLKRVQWYQTEVLHLTVHPLHERQGHAKAILCEVEQVARKNHARILQCTIRHGNMPSRGLFESFGFRQVSMFHNVRSANNIGIFQKVLEPAEP